VYWQLFYHGITTLLRTERSLRARRRQLPKAFLSSKRDGFYSRRDAFKLYKREGNANRNRLLSGFRIEYSFSSEKPLAMNKILIISLLFVLPNLLMAQAVKNTSYTTTTGEKVLRLETIIPVGKKEAWELLATSDGWKKWAAPVVSIDLRIGGAILTNYDTTKSVQDSSAIHLPILNYIEEEMLTLKVELNNSFSAKVRQEDQNLQEIIQIIPIGRNKTKIVSSMIGWGAGDQWDKTYDFFVKGNTWSYEQIAKLYKK